jgi:hypothetical protein
MIAVMPEFVGEDPMVDSSGTTAAGHRIRVEHRCCQYRHDISMGQAVAGVAADSGQLLAAMIL